MTIFMGWVLVAIVSAGKGHHAGVAGVVRVGHVETMSAEVCLESSFVGTVSPGQVQAIGPGRVNLQVAVESRMCVA